MNYPPEFADAGMKCFNDAKIAGGLLMTHCMSCGDCKHLGGPDLDVLLCTAARPLRDDYNAKYALCLPYMELLNNPMVKGGAA